MHNCYKYDPLKNYLYYYIVSLKYHINSDFIWSYHQYRISLFLIWPIICAKTAIIQMCGLKHCYINSDISLFHNWTRLFKITDIAAEHPSYSSLIYLQT